MASIKIPVTKPFLPPLDEYKDLLGEIWERNWLTNNGPVLQRLEKELESYLELGDNELITVSNGTVAIQIAMKAMGLEGEIITTPFSYVATTSSIVWEQFTPVFVDIREDTFNIDEQKIEAAITENTTAILATHVFGVPCDVDAILSIADKHDLKVIYDAAHCFASRKGGQSALTFGNVSAVSFHATKLFQTVEGGAIITSDKELAKRCRFMRNFGHDGPSKFNGVGINGKLSEVHAAMGVVVLRYMDQVIAGRRKATETYWEHLDLDRYQGIQLSEDLDWNYCYFPILFDSETNLIEAQSWLMQNMGVQSRRYFHPSLHTLDYIGFDKELPVVTDIASRILCLPLFDDLETTVIEEICSYLNSL